MSALQKIRAGMRLIGRWLMQIAAGVVIMLALLVGIARLLLPEAASFKEEIRAGVEQVTGFKFNFEMISAGLSVYGPELRFTNAAIQWPDETQIVAANEVAVSLDLLSWVTSGQLLPGRIFIEGMAVDITVAADGEWTVQGRPWRDYLPSDRGGITDIPESRLQLVDIAFSFRNMQRNGPRIAGVINQFDAVLDDARVAVTAKVDPGASYGRALGIEAEFPLQLLVSAQDMQADTPWELRLYAKDFRLDKWLEITELSDFPVIDSEGDADFYVAFKGMRPVAVESELELEQLELAQPGGTPVLIDKLSGNLNWQLVDGGWQATGERLRIDRGSRVWPDSEFMIRYSAGPEPERQHIIANATFLRVEDLLPFMQALMPVQLQEAGFTGDLTGDLSDLGLELMLLDQKVESFGLDVRFKNFGYVSFDKGYDISGFSGRVAADNGGGNLEISTRDARFGVAQLFRDVLDISVLEGLAIWRAGPQGYRLLADGIQLQTPHGEVQASLELSLDADFANPVIDLNAEATLDAIAAAPLYLPKILPPPVLEWLDVALVGGRVVSSDIRIQGPLKKFPYADGEGILYIGMNFVDGVLNYAPDWPVMENASGRLVFDGPSMYSTENKLTISGIEIENIDARIDDMRKGIVDISGSGPIRLENLLSFLQLSPVGAALGPVLADVQIMGDADASMELILPIKDMGNWQLTGQVKTHGAEAGFGDISQHLTDIKGTASIHNIFVTADNLTANFLDEPLTIKVEPVTNPAASISHRAIMDGVMPIYKIQEVLHLPGSRLLDGDINITVQALFPGGGGQHEEQTEGQSEEQAGGQIEAQQEEQTEDQSENKRAEFRLLLRSDLVGMTSILPYPLNKTADDTDGIQIELQFPERGRTHIYGTLKSGLSWALEAINDDQGWSLARGAIMRGVDIPELPEVDGLTVGGEIDSLSLNAWTSVFADASDVGVTGPVSAQKSAGWQQLFRRADLQIGELYAMGHRFVDVGAAVTFGSSAWDIRLTGPWAEGKLVVPYDFQGEQPAQLDMDRLLLIEPQIGDGDDADTQLDPRTLPAVQGRVADFAIGKLRLGTLDADIRRVSAGLKSERLHTESPSFKTDVSYDWLVVDNAQRSRLHMELQSTDVQETLLQLGYAPLVKAKKGGVIADLLWEGGPGMGVLYASTGTIDLSIKDGVVTDVDAGSGRILGLLSVTSLPRRFSLDFKDMTEEGLVFDKIRGRFRIDFGDAWTCSLGLEGPVADMGIVGRTGIIAEDYDQVAAIRPHVSNLAPVAGAFLAGPTVGVAALLITQIMKKPLSSIGESYYTVSGSWDEPQFVKVNRDGLDTTSFTDCEQQLPTLSPEEIEAIEELIANPHVQQSLDAVTLPASQYSSVLPAEADNLPVTVPVNNAAD